MQVEIDNLHKRYVIKNGTLEYPEEFDEVYQTLKQISELIDLPITPREVDVGTQEQYNQYLLAGRLYSQSPLSRKTWYAPGTNPEVAQVIEKHMFGDRQLRFFYGDPVTGEDNLDETSIGHVTRSYGTFRTPMVGSPQEGEDIQLRKIVKIVDVESGNVLWKHANYHFAELRIDPSRNPESGFLYDVLADGKLHSSYKDFYHAAGFVAFLSGVTNTFPHL